MKTFATIISGLQSWRRYGLAVLLGLCVTAALPPYFLLPLAVVGFTLFFLLLSGCQTKRQRFFAGWWFGFGHFVTGLYWIANSLLVDAEQFAWLIPFAVSIIPAYVALYPALVSLMMGWFRVICWQSVVLFACFWTLGEFVRAYMLTGFPWNLTGYIWAGSDAAIQIASVVGIYGLSFLAVLTATVPVLLITKDRQIAAFLCIMVLAGLSYGYGVHRLDQVNKGGDMIQIRIVQPGIPQSLKWEPGKRFEHFAKHVELTRKNGKDGFVPDVVVWPESPVQFYLEEEPELREIMVQSITEGSYIITGATRINRLERKLLNSVLAIDSEGEVVAHYDKYKLVPFGEFIPLRSFLPFVEKITPGAIDFSPGKGITTLKLPEFPPFSPLVCYEIIFSGDVVDNQLPPSWLLNVTNDGWFGDSSGPYQHLAAARLRAVEEGLPVVRAANTGISVVIDRYGTLKQTLALGESGVVDASVQIPEQIHSQTLYAKYGKLIPLLLLLLIFVSAAVLFYNNHYSTTN